MTEQLIQLRNEIDAIDNELLRLINTRARLAQQIGRQKSGTAYRPERESQIFSRLQQANSGPLRDEHVVHLFTEVISICRALEEPLVVAYLGPQGTFSEEAVTKRFGSAVTSIPCSSIDDIFRKVESGAANYGVVPVENSTEGAVGRTMDLLLLTPLKICGELQLPIHQCLMAQHVDLASIRRVYSHPQSFAQCQAWLNENLTAADRINAASNADAARQVAADSSAAAIAGKKAAEVFGLKICATNIEDNPNNTTRFLVVGMQEVAPSGKDKTSLAMATYNRPGSVHELLAPFAQHRVSMTRLESRPSRASLWEYVFFTDIEGHQEDENVARALQMLRDNATFLKVFGSYPAA
ncbi:chorismate mutase /prephenate dehydratase [Nitrosomonas eutropha]|uniref:Bifunctional chorismate mutase/prephenate dehydratase n=1 Tax=Nitrosomonas eutropha TaxID=916 RepID=A0A1I7EUW9_9PROT|nr:prephenate dehydratase [Nitrosomonas eutropha]SFU27734.1 chorismate mutase /prephenate dehydratase [Nitrosomonas eutropha]